LARWLEVRPVTTWGEVDEWYRVRARNERVEHPHAEFTQRKTKRERARVSRAVRLEAEGELRAFARLGASLRFRCRPRGAHIIVERPCFHVPGKWRKAWSCHVSQLMADAFTRKHGMTQAAAASVLVERDRWLEEGAPRRSKLPDVG
jgi:hypothetical protein